MKTIHLLASLSIALSGAALAAEDPKQGHQHGHEHRPLHGGLVAEAGDIDFELVAKTDVITLYVRDHGKAAGTQGAIGKLTLLSGTEKTEVALAPAGDNRLEAKGSFKLPSGTKVVAMVTLPGKKPANVRFVVR